MMYDLVHVGSTRKAVGFDGSIRLDIEDSYISDLIKAEAIFVEYGFEILPFFPDKIENKNQLIIRFDELKGKEAVTKIAGKDVFLRKEEISDFPKEDLREESEVDGFVGLELEDVNHGPIGKITAMESFPQQLMMIVQNETKEIMIPLHPDLVIEVIDGEKIVVELPDGFLDL